MARSLEGRPRAWEKSDPSSVLAVALNNPFQPGSDVVPPIWAGRTAQLSIGAMSLRPRLVAGRFERGRTILGEPGPGKSSLFRRIADDAEAGCSVSPSRASPPCRSSGLS